MSRLLFILMMCFLCFALNAREIIFTEHQITDAGPGNPGLYPADLDSDGDMDIIASQSDPPALKWWRNEGGDPLQWTEFTIEESPAFYVYAEDMNNDENIDILATTTAGEVFCWLNSGSDQPEWDRIILSSGFSSPHGLYACDLDDDGDMDVLATSAGLGRICWWEQEDALWEEHLIRENFPYTQSVHAADLDNDGDLDVLGASAGENMIAVWFNNGGDPLSWSEQIITSDFDTAHWVYACFIDDDDLMDILGASAGDNEIAWWKNDGETPIGWSKHIIDSNTYCAVTAHAADLDNDNDMDVMATAWWGDDIFWWENFSQEPVEWIRHTIDPFNNGAWPIQTADLDNDDDLDIISGADVLTSGGSSAPLTWWENCLTVAVEEKLIIPNKTGTINFHPNPFNSKTKIEFTAGGLGVTEISIYNLRGQKVKTLVQSDSNTQYNSFVWQGDDDQGMMLGSGIYLSILSLNGKHISSGKCMILK